MPQLRSAMAESSAKRAQETYPQWLLDALKTIGMAPEDPAEGAMGTVNPMAAGVMPAVSIFAKQGMGGKAVRQEMTDSALAMLKSTLESIKATPDQIAKTLQLAQKYPRVLAHTTSRPMDEATAGMRDSGLARFEPRGSGLAGTGEITMKPHADPAHSFTHELTHAAQNVSRKGQFTPDFNEAEALLKKQGMDPYWDNPFEINARRAADRRVPLDVDPKIMSPETQDIIQQMIKKRGPVPATTRLRQLRDPS